MAGSIPVVDAADLESGGASVLEDLRVAFGRYGILHVSGHGLEDAALDALYGDYSRFCAAERSIKERMSRPDLWFQRGWTPPNTEFALAGGGQPDFKECYFACCTELAAADRAEFPEINSENVWPDEPAGMDRFASHYSEVALHLQKIGERVLRACALALDLARDTFVDLMRGGPHVTRLLRYLPLDDASIRAGLLWGENHTDFCALTLLPGGRFVDADGVRLTDRSGFDPAASGGGLFLTSRDGELVSGSPPPGCITVQVGQQLETLTGGVLLATPHEIRAPNTAGISRLSGAHFIHMHTKNVVFPLERFRTNESVARYRPPVLAGTYDTKILADIGLAPSDAVERFGYANQDRIPGRRDDR